MYNYDPKYMQRNLVTFFFSNFEEQYQLGAIKKNPLLLSQY